MYRKPRVVDARYPYTLIDNSNNMQQIRPKYRNLCILLVGIFFLWLLWLLFGPGQPSVPHFEINLRELISHCIFAAEVGGFAVVKVHDEKRLAARSKGETKEGAKEFVTRADLISNQLILEALGRLPGLQTVSEEKKSLSSKEVDAYRTVTSYDLWLQQRDTLSKIPDENVPISEIIVWIDPLDATQEYTEDLFQYVTTMVCIVVRGKPRFGVIYRPFFNETIWGHVQGHEFYSSTGAKPAKEPSGNKIIVSRSHAGEVKELAKKAFGGTYEVEPAGGSGYKTLRVVNGTATFYLHQTAIKKWDLCAGDAIIRSVGGQMVTLEGNALTYYSDPDAIVNDKGLLVSLGSPLKYLTKIQAAKES